MGSSECGNSDTIEQGLRGKLTVAQRVKKSLAF
jgi:hypothetical protein